MATPYEEWVKKYQVVYAPEEDQRLAASHTLFDNQKAQTQSTYNKQISDTSNSYEDQYRENAVQKLINERDIAENMAQLGLTDSGLNRTQQTATQLSYANNKAKIDTTRQKAVDTLTAALADAVNKIDLNRSAADETIKSNYYNLAATNAQKSYEQEVETEAAAEKARLEAQTERTKAYYSAVSKVQEQQSHIIQTSGGTLSRDFQGSLEDNNVSVIENEDGSFTYVDNNSGKKSTFGQYVNPFTGKVNPDTSNGVFSNGYQPDNVGNKPLKKVSGVSIGVSGNAQSVWYTDYGHYYFWDGASNKYKQLNSSELQQLGIKYVP